MTLISDSLPSDWFPRLASGAMKRIVLHWTAGAHKANDLDKAHYHLLVEGSGKVVRGTHSIADNVSTADGKYAAHTRNCNAGSIGISACCMGGCQEKPFQAGKWPMTEVQFETMCAVAAAACRFYEIPITDRTVLAHGEVQTNLGIKQLGKWDPLVLPWQPEMSKAEVGAYIRARVRVHFEHKATATEKPADCTIRVGGIGFVPPTALMEDGSSYLALRDVCNALGWTIPGVRDGEAVVNAGGKILELPLLDRGGIGFVSARDLAEALGVGVSWDAATRTVTVG